MRKSRRWVAEASRPSFGHKFYLLNDGDLTGLYKMPGKLIFEAPAALQMRAKRVSSVNSWNLETAQESAATPGEAEARRVNALMPP